MSISSFPNSSAPISADLDIAASGGDQDAIGSPAISNWVIPTQVLSPSGSVSVTGSPAVSNWVIPVQALVLAGVINAPTAEADWVIPAQAISPSGGVNVVGLPAVSRWVIPHQHLVGGEQHGGSNALSGQSGMQQGEISELCGY